MAEKRLKIAEVARRIDDYLQRFERDPKVNAQNGDGLRDYYMAHASVGGTRVFVRYVSYQGQHSLPKWKAEQYLAWLDAGNVGRHFEALR
jgi:hypothetical protein